MLKCGQEWADAITVNMKSIDWQVIEMQISCKTIEPQLIAMELTSWVT